MTKKKCNIFWFRRDLRLDDNVGLQHALQSQHPVLCLFIFDKEILNKLKDPEDKRVDFIHKSLCTIKEQLEEYESDILIEYNTPQGAWENICQTYTVESVYANEDYEPQAISRDKKIETLLRKNKVNLYLFKDQCIFAKNDILKKDGTPYTVYTPFKNKWYETLQPKHIASVKTNKFFNNFLKIKNLHFPSMGEIGFQGNEITYKRLIKSKIIKEYHEKRDIPGITGTSRLGLHLRFGTISVRKCAQIGHELNKTWLDELIWREFFMQVLFHFPHVVNSAFKEKYNNIEWKNSKSDFKKWCDGETGYPIVDAGMKELNETGFMHNRVRMVTASFLVKHLLVDWRWGEKYFAQKLLDFDLSANNGNWQWVAGTGCDAAPYFRIFNPHNQLKKFDPDYVYVKKWLPSWGTNQYPQEMIDHRFAYDRALATYKIGIG